MTAPAPSLCCFVYSQRTNTLEVFLELAQHSHTGQHPTLSECSALTPGSPDFESWCSCTAANFCKLCRPAAFCLPSFTSLFVLSNNKQMSKDEFVFAPTPNLLPWTCSSQPFLAFSALFSIRWWISRAYPALQGVICQGPFSRNGYQQLGNRFWTLLTSPALFSPFTQLQSPKSHYLSPVRR